MNLPIQGKYSLAQGPITPQDWVGEGGLAEPRFGPLLGKHLKVVPRSRKGASVRSIPWQVGIGNWVKRNFLLLLYSQVHSWDTCQLKTHLEGEKALDSDCSLEEPDNNVRRYNVTIELTQVHNRQLHFNILQIWWGCSVGP